MIILLAANPLVAGDNINHEQIKQGFYYINEAQYRNAIKAFEKATETNPENADAYYGLGISYLRLGDTKSITIPQLVQEAIYSFKKAQNFGATYPEIYYFLGLSYLLLNDKELAIKQYDVLEDLNSNLADRLLNKIVTYERLREDINNKENLIPFEKKE